MKIYTMPELGLLIKPASSLCNLRCRYCFYHSVADMREVTSYGVMEEPVLEELIKKAYAYARKRLTLAFQGGEPTVAGLDYFRKAVKLCEKYNTAGIKTEFSIQTNGTLLDGDWIDFFREHDFLVGLSLDGPKDINDLLRVDAGGDGSYSRVMKAAAMMKKAGVRFNILCVVSKAVARHGGKVYSFFKRSGFGFVQFIPCIDPFGGEKNGFSVTPELYAGFLKTVFDAWYSDFKKGLYISVRYFDNLVGMVGGYPPEQCGMLGHCVGQFVVEADGGVYPCDFYVLEEWLTGNISTSTFEEIAASDVRNAFTASSEYAAAECESCTFRVLCRGGCRRDREPFTDGKPSLNRFCPAYKEFFAYALPRMKEMAAMLRSGWRPAGPQ